MGSDETKPERPKIVKISDKSTSPYSWSPVQLLEAFLEEIKSGKIAPVALQISFFVENESGARVPKCWIAGLSRPEQIALLAVQQARLIEDWRS